MILSTATRFANAKINIFFDFSTVNQTESAMQNLAVTRVVKSIRSFSNQSFYLC
jgi:hypothetical protein